MEVVILNATISPQIVKTGQEFKISVDVRNVTPDPKMYRLPFRTRKNKTEGGVK